MAETVVLHLSQPFMGMGLFAVYLLFICCLFAVCHCEYKTKFLKPTHKKILASFKKILTPRYTYPCILWIHIFKNKTWAHTHCQIALETPQTFEKRALHFRKRALRFCHKNFFQMYGYVQILVKRASYFRKIALETPHIPHLRKY